MIAGVFVLLMQAGVLAIVGDTVENSTVNLLRLTLSPWSSARLALLVALVVLQAIALWLAILIFRVAMAGWRVDRLPWWQRLLVPIGWMLPSLLVAGSTIWREVPLPHLPLVLMAVLAASVAYLARFGVPWYRHGSQATRMAALFLALLVPALLLYPSLVHFVDGAKMRLIETQYAVETRSHPAELLAHLNEALRQVDRVPGLPDLVESLSGSAPSTEAAFSLWSATDLEQFRLTSAVELYGSDGALVSRFALNLPDTEAADNYKSKRCDWEIFGQAIPVGADERRMLHAERGICAIDPGTNKHTHRRRRRPPRDARLQRAAIHLVAEPVFRVHPRPASRNASRHDRRRRRARGLRLGALCRSSRRAIARGSSATTSSRAPINRASRSGPSSRAATSAITPTSPTIAPASTSSAIRC